MTTSRRATALLLVSVAVQALAALAFRNWSRPSVETPAWHVTQLRIDREAAAIDEVVAVYQPRVPAPLDDLAVPVEDVLRGLPGVAVEVFARPMKPAASSTPATCISRRETYSPSTSGRPPASRSPTTSSRSSRVPVRDASNSRAGE